MARIIEKEKNYNLTEIVREGLLPWVKSYPTALRIVLEDKADKQLLAADIIGEGKGRTIRIKGSNLARYIGENKAKLGQYKIIIK